MKDFFNFGIDMAKGDEGTVIFTLSHNKREGVSVEFKTSEHVRAEHIPALIKGVMDKYSQKYTAVTRKALTPGQKNFYDKLVDFHREEGRPPSYEEQRLLIGAKSKGTPWQYAKKLMEKGWVWADTEGLIIPVDIAPPHMIE